MCFFHKLVLISSKVTIYWAQIKDVTFISYSFSEIGVLNRQIFKISHFLFKIQLSFYSPLLIWTLLPIASQQIVISPQPNLWVKSQKLYSQNTPPPEIVQGQPRVYAAIYIILQEYCYLKFIFIKFIDLMQNILMHSYKKCQC